MKQNTKYKDSILCIKCKDNPKEYNDYCYSCAVAIIAQFKENQLRELMCDIRAQRAVGDLKK